MKLSTSLLVIVVVVVSHIDATTYGLYHKHDSASRVMARKLSAQSPQEDKNFNEVEARQSAEVALDKFFKTDTNVCNRDLKVVKLTKVLVEKLGRGVKYTVTFTVVPTLDKCDYDEKKDYECTAEVVVSTRSGTKDPKKIDCGKLDFSLVPPGGWKKIFKNKEQFVNYAQLGLNHYGCKQDTVCTKNLLVNEIEYVEIQTVNGYKYRLKFSYKPYFPYCENLSKNYPDCVVVVNVPFSKRRSGDITVDESKVDCEKPNFKLSSDFSPITP